MKLRPTEKRFYELLSDGMPHTIDEFKLLLHDAEGAEDATAEKWISNLRKTLEASSLAIMMTPRNRARPCTYRLVRYISREGKPPKGEDSKP